MGIDRETLRQLGFILRPLATRIANTVARSVVQLVNDARKLQTVQLGILADEDGDDGEHHQAYGFSSVPLPGAEAVVLFPNGDRSHPLVVAVSDRRHRPTGGEPGQVTMYHHTGTVVTMLANGSVEIRSAEGSAVALAKQSDLLALRNHVAGLFVGGSGSAIDPSCPSAGTGTIVLKAE